MKNKAVIILMLMIILLTGIIVPQKACQAKAVKPAKDIKTLSAALKAGVPVIVKLGADWCPPCRAMKPVLKALSDELKGKAVVLDLDIEQHRDLAREFKVTLIPTTIFYDKKGKPAGKQTGFMSKDDILKKIKELGLNK